MKTKLTQTEAPQGEDEMGLENELTEVSTIRKIECTIRGTRPLLINKFNPGAESGRDITPEQECKERLYVSNGELVQPAIHIEKALEKSAVEVKMAGRGKKTYKDWVKAFVTVDPVYIPHKYQKWEVDSRPLVIKATKGRIMRHRPILNEWELSFTISVKNPNMPITVIEKCLKYAGENNGLGDYRPKFGLFEVTKFAVIER